MSYNNNNEFEQQQGSANFSPINGAGSFDQNMSSGGQGSEQYQGYTPQEPGQFNLSSIQLPPPQMGCYQPPGQMKGQVQHRKGQETNETKTVEQTLNDTKTATRENAVHHQHVKNVLINVNRNHNHLVKVVNRDSNHHHHLINNIVRVNDIHNQKIEEVRGEGRTTKDYKQTSRVEAGQCRRGTTDGGSGGAGGYSQGGNSSANYQSHGSANYQSQGGNSSANYQSHGSANYSQGHNNNYNNNGSY